MMPTKANDAKPAKEEERSPLFATARKVLLASVGAVALAQDEMEEFVNRLVERGEIAERDGKNLVREMVERRKKGTQKAGDKVTQHVEEILDRMNVPTKADIEALSEKIAALSKKVDELRKTQG